MERQQTRYVAPLRIDEHLVAALSSVARDVQQKTRRCLASAEGLSEQQVDDLLHGKHPKGLSEFQCEGLAKDFRRAGEANFTVTFADGSSVETTDSLEIVDTLKTRSSQPEKLGMEAGAYGHLTLSLDIQSFLSRSATWRISGGRADVRDLDLSIRAILDNAEPEFAFMRHPAAFFGVATVTLVFEIIIYTYVTRYFVPGESLRKQLIAGLFMALATAFLASKTCEAFPLVEFSFGRSAQRTATKRRLITWALGTLLIPIIFAVL